MSNVKVAIWLGGETGDRSSMFSTLQIVGDDLANKVFFLVAHDLLKF
jgi:hypothetical protein